MEPGFLVAASFGISVGAGFTYGLHEDTRIGRTDFSFLTIRTFDPLRLIFTTSDRSLLLLLAPTVS